MSRTYTHIRGGKNNKRSAERKARHKREAKARRRATKLAIEHGHELPTERHIKYCG